MLNSSEAENRSLSKILRKSHQSPEKRLEEAFFRSHPRSLQRTVEFIIDRCVSNCVKHFRTQIVPEQLQSSNKTKGIFLDNLLSFLEHSRKTKK